MRLGGSQSRVAGAEQVPVFLSRKSKTPRSGWLDLIVVSLGIANNDDGVYRLAA